LPRKSEILKSFLNALNCAALLGLDVPILAPSFIFLKNSFPLEINTSHGSILFIIAATINPSGKSTGKSFILCTANEISFLKRASSISFVNSPLPPIFDKAMFWILSPLVFIIFRLNSNFLFMVCILPPDHFFL